MRDGFTSCIFFLRISIEMRLCFEEKRRQNHCVHGNETDPQPWGVVVWLLCACVFVAIKI